MASDILRSIIEKKVDVFASLFGNEANKLFKKENRLIHSLEYGMYRERCAKELLKLICNKNIAISDGFMISSENNVSTQCDIIMYQRDTMPVVDNDITNYFPVEIVKCIGEVKSTLSKSDLKTALVKMAKNKKMFLERKGAQKATYCLEERDEIISFLICNNLNFKFEDLDFENIYKDISDIRFRHNMILSLQDGLWLYEFDADKAPEVMRVPFNETFEAEIPMWYFPHSSIKGQTYKCDSYFIKADTENVYEHIIQFLNGLLNAMSGQREYQFDIGNYITDNIIELRKS